MLATTKGLFADANRIFLSINPLIVPVSTSFDFQSLGTPSITYAILGSPREGQKDLVYTPFKFGTLPDSIGESEDRYISKRGVSEKPAPDFFKTMAWLNMQANVVNRTTQSNLGLRRRSLAFEIAKENLTQGRMKHVDLFAIGLAGIASDVKNDWNQASELFLRSAELFMAEEMHAAAAISSELAAEAFHHYLGSSRQKAPSRMELEARELAAKNWLYSTSHPKEALLRKLKVQRAIYNAQFSGAPDLIVALLAISAGIHRAEGNREEEFNDLVRALWHLTSPALHKHAEDTSIFDLNKFTEFLNASISAAPDSDEKEIEALKEVALSFRVHIDGTMHSDDASRDENYKQMGSRSALRAHADRVLAENGGNISKSAEKMGMPVEALCYLIASTTETNALGLYKNQSKARKTFKDHEVASWLEKTQGSLAVFSVLTGRLLDPVYQRIISSNSESPLWRWNPARLSQKEIQEALRTSNGNLREASKILGVAYEPFYTQFFKNEKPTLLGPYDDENLNPNPNLIPHNG